MALKLRMVSFLDAKFSHWPLQNTAKAIKTLKANNISINLYGNPLEGKSRLGIGMTVAKVNKLGVYGHLKPNEVASNIKSLANSLADERTIKEIKFLGIKQIDVSSPFNPVKIWSKDLYDAIQNILLFIKKTRVYTDEQKGTYYSTWTKFKEFACSARTPEEKDLVIKILFDLEEIHDPGTAQHSRQTREWAVDIGRQMKLSEEEIKTLGLAAYLHDLGKIGVERDILSKRSQLTKDDFSRIKNHVSIGGDILKACGWTDDILGIISYHHYIKNYPKDIDPKKAPLLARVLAVADSIEAGTAVRPYKIGKDLPTVLKELRDPKGNYDQKVVDAFEELLKNTSVLKEM